MGTPQESLRMAWEVPYGSLYLRLDALSAFFLLPIFFHIRACRTLWD